jgi:hypothetical protein
MEDDEREDAMLHVAENEEEEVESERVVVRKRS